MIKQPIKNVLILHYYFQHPKRATLRDHLYCFRKYSNHRCYYLNVAYYGVPWYVKRFPWDLIIIHTLFLSSRFTRELFIKACQDVTFLKQSRAIKVILPQDEFINMDLICDFINGFGINHVFSVAPESEWRKIYWTVDFEKVRFHKVLTGYIEEDTVAKVEEMSVSSPAERPIDIGYRVWRTPFWLGRGGQLKWLIADVFRRETPARGLKVDISSPESYNAVIPGNDWYRFLLRCKYQLGAEGGASLFDWNGEFREKTEKYVSLHPDVKFEEVERVCFPGADGSLRLYALSPRHLEACITKTCQILVEGNYDGVLVAGKHYIELKRDFSNLETVLDAVASDSLREKLTKAAWEDIVKSGEFSYRRFVDYVINTSIALVPQECSTGSAIWGNVVYQWMRFLSSRLAIFLAIPGVLRVVMLLGIPRSKKLAGKLFSLESARHRKTQIKA